MSDKILTTKEVTVYLMLAEKTTYRLAAESKLSGLEEGGQLVAYRFDGERALDAEKFVSVSR